MKKGILGKKIGITQCFTDKGVMIPVTIIEAGPCTVLSMKEGGKNGGGASVRLGYDDKKETRTNKPDLGNFKKSKSSPKRYIKEVGVDSLQAYKVGQQVTVDIFRKGEYVDVTGTSKGKGFQGGIKRWNWTAGKSGHGSMHHRQPGSIGASSFPSRVFKGQHLAGHMGNKKVTVQNLRIVDIDKEHNLLAVEGTVPGHNNGYLTIRTAKKMPAVVAETASKKEDKKGK